MILLGVMGTTLSSEDSNTWVLPENGKAGPNERWWLDIKVTPQLLNFPIHPFIMSLVYGSKMLTETVGSTRTTSSSLFTISDNIFIVITNKSCVYLLFLMRGLYLVILLKCFEVSFLHNSDFCCKSILRLWVVLFPALRFSYPNAVGMLIHDWPLKNYYASLQPSMYSCFVYFLHKQVSWVHVSRPIFESRLSILHQGLLFSWKRVWSQF